VNQLVTPLDTVQRNIIINRRHKSSHNRKRKRRRCEIGEGEMTALDKNHQIFLNTRHQEVAKRKVMVLKNTVLWRIPCMNIKNGFIRPKIRSSGSEPLGSKEGKKFLDYFSAH
jgi:hypothetical protein